jgi:hypothetical protein
MKHALVIGLALLNAACATTYGEIGSWTGDGVSADALSADTFRIRSRGNSNTEPSLIEDFALLRAAETVKQACYTHFVVLDRADRTKVEEVVTPETVTKTVEEKEVDGKKTRVERRSVTPGSVSLEVRPGEDLVVKAVRLAPGAAAPEGAFSAEDILAHVSPRVVRRKDSPPVVFPAC